MIMQKQVLGSLTFQRNPKTMGLIESKKTVAIVDTYSGSAIFQWEATIQGESIPLKWDWMSASEYESLRTMYLSMDTYLWNPRTGTNYNVIIESLNGDLYENALYNLLYRKNVVLVLNIRSIGA